MTASPSGGGVVTFGEALAVLRTTEPGTLAHLTSLAVGTGGAEANVAVGLARLGAPLPGSAGSAAIRSVGA